MDDQHGREALGLAAESIGEMMAFWGLKRSMGVIWTVLYLYRRPMSQDELVQATGLSMGMISMTLAEIEGWGVVRRELVARDRRRYYVAETDVQAMITRVLERRELHKVRDTAARLEQAAEMLRQPSADAPGAEKTESIIMAQRMDALVDLARAGESMVKRLVQLGQMDLGPLPNLSRRGRERG